MPSTPSPPPPAAGEHRRLPPKEEPEFVNEADIPSENEPTPQVSGDESAAGEEDPGAALDAPTGRGSGNQDSIGRAS